MKSKARALTSFIMGLTFWIPLLNLIFGGIGIYLGITALSKIKQSPKQYAGKWLAILGIILGSLVYFLYLVGLSFCIFGFKSVCSSIGLTFMSN